MKMQVLEKDEKMISCSCGNKILVESTKEVRNYKCEKCGKQHNFKLLVD